MVLPDLRRRSEDDSERAWSEVVAGVLQLGSVCASLPPELMVIVEDDGATQRVLGSLHRAEWRIEFLVCAQSSQSRRGSANLCSSLRFKVPNGDRMQYSLGENTNRSVGGATERS